MVKVQVGNHNFYMDGFLKTNMDRAKEIIKKDWDMVFVVDGMEGSGKSVLAMQIAKYLDPSFNIDRVVFNPFDFSQAIIHAKKFEAVVYDEGFTGLSARATMSTINRSLVTMLAEIRQKNLFVFVVMPTFFDLDRNVALWRSRALFHVYAEGFKRGSFSFFNSERKKNIYIFGKKTYSYNCKGSMSKPNFYGSFTNYYVLDQDLYRRKKKAALERPEEDRWKQQVRKDVEKELFGRIMELEDVKHDIKMAILEMKPATYFRKKKKYEESPEEFLK